MDQHFFSPLPTFEEWESQSRSTAADMPIHISDVGIIKGWLNCQGLDMPDESEMIPLPAGDYSVYCGQDGYLRLNFTGSDDYYYVKLGEFETVKNRILMEPTGFETGQQQVL